MSDPSYEVVKEGVHYGVHWNTKKGGGRSGLLKGDT